MPSHGLATTRPTRTRTTRAIFQHTLQLFWLLCLTAPAAVSHAQWDDHQPEARLTDRQRIVLGGSVQGLLDGNASVMEWCISAWPEAMYFPLDRLGVGARVGAGYSTTSVLGNERTTWEAGMLVGINYEVRLSERVSFLPRAWLGWVHEQSERSFTIEDEIPGVVAGDSGPPPAAGVQREERDFMRGVLELPIIVHLSGSVAVGLGPVILLDHIRSPSAPPMEYSSYVSYGDTSPFNRLRLGLSAWIGVAF